MSHSKFTKHGKSLYIEKSNPATRRFINTCTLCGARGYSPTIDEAGFVEENPRHLSDLTHTVMKNELKRVFRPLPLDALGRCADCATIMDKK